MKALVYDGPKMLTFRDVATPVPHAGQQLIKVFGAVINLSLIHI